MSEAVVTSVSEPFEDALPSVQLENFEGPLDMLLHLIRSQKMDIFDIPVATLTAQYLATIESYKQANQTLNLEVAGDYLVMASTLMQLKSRLLLPRPELDEDGEEIDPRAGLVAQLMAYEQYRMLAEEMDERPRMGRDVFGRAVFPEADMVERPLPMADLDALLLSFRNVLKRVGGGEVHHHVFLDTMSVREQMGIILERIQQGGVLLEELLSQPGREMIVTTLLAILELWRQSAITVVQNACYTSVSILPKEAHTS